MLRVLAMAAQRRLKTPTHLILDWDGTLTTKDTMDLVGQLAVARDACLDRRQQGPAWSKYYNAYKADYERHKAAHHPREAHVTPDRYRQWLESLRPIEYASAQRADDDGYFEGINMQDVTTVAGEALSSGALELRTGWNNLFRLFLPSATPPQGSQLSILSVNWCNDLIRESLRLSVERQSELARSARAEMLDMIANLDIQANILEGLHSAQGASGRLVGDIRTAEDKLRRMPSGRGSAEGPDPKPLVVYVGDSATDYAALRNSDVGIWLCDDEERAHEHFAKTFAPLDTRDCKLRRLGDGNIGPPEKLCAWTKDLEEVAEYLSETQP